MSTLHSTILAQSGLEKSGNLVVRYGKKQVMGQQLAKAATTAAPKVVWSDDNALPDALYTLALIDPDAPVSKASGKEWLHWLVVNIKNADIASGTVVQPYEGPTPPPSSGVHRYIFAWMQQSHSVHIAQTLAPSRSDFSLKEFIQQHGLAVKQKAQFTVDSM